MKAMKLILPLLILAILVGIVSAAQPTITIVTPATNLDIHRNSTTFNVSITNGALSWWNATNATFYIKSNSNTTYNYTGPSSHGHVVSAGLCDNTNLNALNNNCSSMFLVVNLTDIAWIRDDDIPYTVNISVGFHNGSPPGAATENSVNTTYVSATRTFRVDNSVPECVISSGQSAGNYYLSDMLWYVTAANASAAEIRFGNNIWRTMSENGTAESNDRFSFTDNVGERSYDEVLVRTWDGLNSTQCRVEGPIIIDDEEGNLEGLIFMTAAEESVAQQEAQRQNMTKLLFGAVIVLVLINWKKIFKKR